MKFIKDRLNKDNFWNLMFMLGMSVGISSSFLFANSNIYLASALFWLTIIAVPFTVNKFARVSFDEHRNFLTKEGRILNKKLLRYFAVMIIATVLIFSATGSMLDSFKYKLSDQVACCLMIAVFFFVPVLYFIIINCPISISFNKNAWLEKIFGFNAHAMPNYNIHSSTTHNLTTLKKVSSESIITSPGYSWYSGNIHNSRYHK